MTRKRRLGDRADGFPVWTGPGATELRAVPSSDHVADTARDGVETHRAATPLTGGDRIAAMEISHQHRARADVLDPHCTGAGDEGPGGGVVGGRHHYRVSGRVDVPARHRVRHSI